ncbi:MAG: YidB family protein [Spirochaetota bacterium]
MFVTYKQTIWNKKTFQKTDPGMTLFEYYGTFSFGSFSTLVGRSLVWQLWYIVHISPCCHCFVPGLLQNDPFAGLTAVETSTTTNNRKAKRLIKLLQGNAAMYSISEVVGNYEANRVRVTIAILYFFIAKPALAEIPFLMGFLESVLSEVTSSGKQSSLDGIDVGSVAKVLLSSSSGESSNIDTIVSVLKEKGLENQVASWVGSGGNEEINDSDLGAALGSELQDDLASKLGIDSEQVGKVLTSLLPVIVNQLTPEGKTDSDGSLLTTGMTLLKGFL